MSDEQIRDFDAQVRAIRASGIAAKCIRKPKALCTPEQWAAHREYMRMRHLDPVARKWHKESQLRYLAKKSQAMQEAK